MRSDGKAAVRVEARGAGEGLAEVLEALDSNVDGNVGPQDNDGYDDGTGKRGFDGRASVDFKELNRRSDEVLNCIIKQRSDIDEPNSVENRRLDQKLEVLGYIPQNLASHRTYALTRSATTLAIRESCLGTRMMRRRTPSLSRTHQVHAWKGAMVIFGCCTWMV